MLLQLVLLLKAVAARQVEMDSYLLLRHNPPVLPTNPAEGLQGNLLFSRLSGAKIRMFPPADVKQYGYDGILSRAVSDIEKSGNSAPYIIPLGGSKCVVVGVMG